MRFYLQIIITLLAGLLFACAGEQKPLTPLETLKAYTTAIKKKDPTTMKMLLSDASIEMAKQEARAQNVSLDEIVKKETLFRENQSTVEFRNEKIEGDKATIEMKDSFDTWSTVLFIREDGIWKIDKQGIANQMILEFEREFERKNKELDDNINQGKQP